MLNLFLMKNNLKKPLYSAKNMKVLKCIILQIYAVNKTAFKMYWIKQII